MLDSRQTSKKRGVAALGVLALVATALPLTSMAANAGYVDRERVFDNKVTAGADLDLVVAQNGGATINDAAVPAGYEIAWDGSTAGQNSDTNTKGTMRLNAPNIAPGDTVKIPLTPENVGNLPMTYTLDACVVADVQAATSLDGIDDGDASDFAGVGADTTSTTGVVVSILDSDGNVLGTTDAGGNCTFDTARALAVGANEELTLQLAFPTTMTNAATGAVVDVDLTFNGAQSSAGGLDVSGITTSSPIDKVAMGNEHTCEIRNGGEVWCWGRDNLGQLGNGGGDNTNATASRAGTISDAVSVWAGLNSSFAITSTGDLYAWGENNNGELGVGNTTNQQSPVLVSGISGVKKVAGGVGYVHTIILLDDGTVRVAGSTSYAGAPSGSYSYTFVTLTSISGLSQFSGVKDIANGYQSTYLINGDGTVWGVGNRFYNALANGDASVVTTTWTRIGTRTDAEQLWGRVFGGVYKTTNGEYYGWGWDAKGQLGLGNISGARSHTVLPHYADAKQLAFGGAHAIMLKNDGTVWANGLNNNGQLGDGSTSNKYSPVQVSGISGDVTGVVAGDSNSFAFTTTGRYAWGHNTNGQLGVANTSSNQSTPQPVIQ